MVSMGGAQRLKQENQSIAGFPEWTEPGRETGRDPLGMLRPIELVYQSLLSGISTITLRLGYYSFFCWLIEAYEKDDDITNDYVEFQRLDLGIVPITGL